MGEFSNAQVINYRHRCGAGEPLTSALIDAGHSVWAIDASARLVDAFKKRFPGISVACESVEESSFFQRRFDAALMVGLVFLFQEDRQVALLKNLSSVLLPGGHLLFSAPRQTGSWKELLTKNTCWSLGAETYHSLLEQSGFSIIATHEDEGGSHYYEAKRE
ncbi:MAG: class I SAM-dependent methyltransferase [Pseudomonadota bacterium]